MTRLSDLESAAAAARDRERMLRALGASSEVRCVAPPNPWVGAVVATEDGRLFEGATGEPGRHHAEVVALHRAGDAARGATLYVTLEPCSHQGRTGPCTRAIAGAGIARVVVGLQDPDPRVDGSGIAWLRAQGIAVDVGVCADKVRSHLRPYLHHRLTGRPWVVLKLAATIDGRTAAPDGSSKWITSPESRRDGHRLRAESDAILVGAGTVRRDDPGLTVRDWKPPLVPSSGSVDPVRVILGRAPEGARVHPCLEMSGELAPILTDLGARGVVQLLVEGGANVAGSFHRAGLVNQYVFYLAPAVFGGEDARPMFAGPGAWSMDGLWRGEIVGIERLGPDLRVEMIPRDRTDDRDGAADLRQDLG